MKLDVTDILELLAKQIELTALAQEELVKKYPNAQDYGKGVQDGLNSAAASIRDMLRFVEEEMARKK